LIGENPTPWVMLSTIKNRVLISAFLLINKTGWDMLIKDWILKKIEI
jgi:hypothetical protein